MQNREYYVKLPEHMPLAESAHIARLQEKQWRARLWLNRNPFARAHNLRWRAHFKDCAKVVRVQTRRESNE